MSLEAARYELTCRENVAKDLEHRLFMADLNRDKRILEFKLSEARIFVRQQQATVARLERLERLTAPAPRV